MATQKKSGIDLIAQERKEQLEKHGRSVAEDVRINEGCKLTWGAVQLFAPEFAYAVDKEDMPVGWDENVWQKMIGKSYVERLTIAGALLAAEIDRVNAED